MRFEVYTDGSCSRNPGAGGYGIVVLSPRGNQLLQISGSEVYTTNNRMELKAICSALKHLNADPYYNSKSNTIVIYSDSAYCINAITQNWISGWKAKDWKTGKGEEVKNLELWKEVDTLLHKIRAKIVFEKVKGHAGNKWNEVVDGLAREATKRALERAGSQNS